LNPAITLAGHLLGGIATIFGTVFKSVFDWFMGAFKVLEGIATLDFSKIGSGLWTMISATFLHIPKVLLSVFTVAFNLLYIQIPQYLLSIFWNAFKLLYIQLPIFLMGIPKMIFDAVWSGLTSLASNDWVGPIFQPFLDILAPINEALGVLYSAFGELFNAVNLLLEPVYFLFDAIGSLFSSSESTGESMGFLKNIIYGLSSAIGFVIKVALFPIQLLFRGLALVMQPVIWFVNLLVSAISSLIKPLWSVVGTLLNGFVGAISYVGEIISGVMSAISEGINRVRKVISDIVDFIMAPFRWLYDYLGGIFSSIPETLSNALYSGMSSVGLGWLFDSISGTSGGKTKSTAEANAVAAAPKVEIDEESFSRVFGAAKTQEMLGRRELGFSQKSVANTFDGNMEAAELTAMNLALKNMIDPLGIGSAITGLSPSTASVSQTVASPIAATSIDERVQRDLATSEPEMASVGGPELGAIAESSDIQVEKLDQMVGILQSMLENMSQSGSTSYAAELASMNEIPKKPTRYNPLSTGKYATSASKQIKNASQSGT
jgi:hypothetical protein